MLRFGLILFLFLQITVYNVSEDYTPTDIAIISKSFNKSYYTYQLNVTYPEIREIKNKMNTQHHKLNFNIQGVMFGAINTFQDKVKLIEDKNSFSYLNFDYTICSNFEEAMSLRFLNRTYLPGMDNAQELYRTINYDKKLGTIIKLHHLFDPTINHNQELIKIINSKFSNCTINPSIKLNSFCLSEDYLTIILDKNILPDNFCSTEVKISWTELSHFLDTENIGYRLFKQVTF